jgi:hypothetical protein
MTYKHVAISQQSFDHLDALAKSWKMDKKEFVENIITYFRLTGDDPAATKKDNTAVAIKKLQNSVISFFQVHEKDHLKKIVTDFEETRKELALSQTTLTNEINTAIETGRKEDRTAIEAGRKEDRGLLNSWMFNRMSLKDGSKFSVKDQFDITINKEEEIIHLIKKMGEKADKKKEVLTTRLEAMEEGIKKWGAITKDGNKERALALTHELKTLVSGTY